MTLYAYQITQSKLIDSVEPKTDIVAVQLDFEPTSARVVDLGPSISATLRFPHSADATLTSFRAKARMPLPELLPEAARIADEHLHIDGSELQSETGLS